MTPSTESRAGFDAIISHDSVGKPQKRLEWQVAIGLYCAGCHFEALPVGECANVKFPGGKDCLDMMRENSGKNMILVEVDA